MGLLHAVSIARFKPLIDSHAAKFLSVTASCLPYSIASLSLDAKLSLCMLVLTGSNLLFRGHGECPTGASIAPSWIDLSGAVTSTSSTAHGGEASRVVASANPSSRWGDNTCSHTNGDGENTPWWKVELGGNYGVSKVLVLNRGDCCGERLNGFTVKVGDTECATNVQITQGQALEVPCIGTGSSVTISLPRHDILTLCEVKVFGYGTTAA